MLCRAGGARRVVQGSQAGASVSQDSAAYSTAVTIATPTGAEWGAAPPEPDGLLQDDLEDYADDLPDGRLNDDVGDFLDDGLSDDPELDEPLQRAETARWDTGPEVSGDRFGPY